MGIGKLVHMFLSEIGSGFEELGSNKFWAPTPPPPPNFKGLINAMHFNINCSTRTLVKCGMN